MLNIMKGEFFGRMKRRNVNTGRANDTNRVGISYKHIINFRLIDYINPSVIRIGRMNRDICIFS